MHLVAANVLQAAALKAFPPALPIAAKPGFLQVVLVLLAACGESQRSLTVHTRYMRHGVA